MRDLQLNELVLVSGGSIIVNNLPDEKYFSDAFLAGMQGGSVSYINSSTIVPALFFGLVGAAFGPGGSIGGIAFGILIGLAIINGEYHSGENYVAAQRILNG